MKVAVWLGSAPPLRSSRWLDGSLATAATFSDAIAIAAGDPAWLDVANARAARAKLACIGVPTTLQLDYLGWAQIVAAAVRHVGATTVLVDEASRPERWAEVAAIAEILDAAQLTHVVSLAHEGEIIETRRASGTQLQTVRLRGPAVIGVRIAGAALDDVAGTPGTRVELAAIGIDPLVLGHRALPVRAAVASTQTPKQSIERIVDHLAVHLVPRSEAR